MVLNELLRYRKQINDITKLTLSKISNMSVSDEDIKDVVRNIQEKAIN